MAYPFTWTPEHVVPTNANQVSVLNAADGSAATLSTAVAVSSGTVTFAATNSGQYLVKVKGTGGNAETSKTFYANATTGTPTLAAGANAGTTPPTPTLDAGGTDLKGRVRFGTGATPAIGVMVTVTFSNTLTAVPTVQVTLSAQNGSTPFVSNVTATGFSFGMLTAPTASQAVGTYAFNYAVTV